jgi:predicted GTPase
MEQKPGDSYPGPTNASGTIVDFIERVCSEFHIASLNRQIQACKTLFVKSPFIDVAIFGQFKAGKSSFINSLIGKDVLPVGVIPVTTVITRLRYGPKEKANVYILFGCCPHNILAERYG